MKKIKEFPDSYERMENRRRLDAMKKEQLSKRPKPEIDVVSETEIYLVEKGVRVKRICGRQLKHGEEGYVCLKEAGLGTSHRGVGYCYIHDKRVNKVSDPYWERLNLAMNIPKDLGELYARAEGLSKHELLSPINQVRRIAALYWDILNNPEDEDENGEKRLSAWQRKELRNLEELWLKAIDMDRKLEGQDHIKGAVVSKFLQGIYDIIFESVGIEVGRNIINRILKLTYAYHEEGEIKGDLGNIESKAIKTELRIEAHKKGQKRILTDAEVIEESE